MKPYRRSPNVLYLGDRFHFDGGVVTVVGFTRDRVYVDGRGFSNLGIAYPPPRWTPS